MPIVLYCVVWNTVDLSFFFFTQGFGIWVLSCVVAPARKPQSPAGQAGHIDTGRVFAWERQTQRLCFLHSLPFGRKVRWAISEMPPVKINWQIVELSSRLLFVVGIGGGSVCSVCSSSEAGGQAMPHHREWENEREGRKDIERQRDGEKRRLGGGRWVAERDREGVKASTDTSRCQTHRHTAATDSSLQLRLEAQLDTGNEWAGDEEWSTGR